MLGIFALAGMIATPIIAGKMLKKDFRNHTVDSVVKPCIQYSPIGNTIKNKKTIERNFLNICKRCEMTINKQDELLDIRECKIGEEYLMYQGFDEESVEYFKELFDKNIRRGRSRQRIEIKEKHEKYLEMLESDPQDWETTIYRKNYYGNEQINYRLNKLMENELWGKIVFSKPRYITGEGTAKYMELHVIKAPKPIIKDLNNIYKEVCWLQGLEDGKW